MHVAARGQSVECGALLPPCGSSGFNSVIELDRSKNL